MKLHFINKTDKTKIKWVNYCLKELSVYGTNDEEDWNNGFINIESEYLSEWIEVGIFEVRGGK
jgi:hypothetical protein